MARHSKVEIEHIFEVRYERGYRYLDRCGDAMIVLETALSQETNAIWMQEEMKPTGARLKAPSLDMVVGFDTARMYVGQTSPTAETHKLMDIVCEMAWAIVSGRFGIEKITRVGCRFNSIIPTDSIEEAQALSNKLAPFSGWGEVSGNAFRRSEAECAATFENEDRNHGYRVELAPGYRMEAPLRVDDRLRTPPRLLAKGQREVLLSQLRRHQERVSNPIAGTMFDVDYYKIDLRTIDCSKVLSEGRTISDQIAAKIGLLG